MRVSSRWLLILSWSCLACTDDQPSVRQDSGTRVSAVDGAASDASERVSIAAAIHMAQQIDGDRRLADLTGEELVWLCYWDAAMSPSAETFVDCDSGPIRVSVVYACRRYDVAPGCKATVADVRACTNASLRDPCTIHAECRDLSGCLD
jgi:hypothetical protein